MVALKKTKAVKIEKKPKPKTKEVKRRYVSKWRIKQRLEEGWKAIPTPKDEFGKIIGKNGGDLTLMEKEI